MFDGRTDGSASCSRARWSCSHWPRSRARSLSSPAPTPSTRQRQRSAQRLGAQALLVGPRPFPAARRAGGRARRIARDGGNLQPALPAARRHSASRGRSPDRCSDRNLARRTLDRLCQRRGKLALAHERTAASSEHRQRGLKLDGSDSLVAGASGAKESPRPGQPGNRREIPWHCCASRPTTSSRSRRTPNLGPPCERDRRDPGRRNRSPAPPSPTGAGRPAVLGHELPRPRSLSDRDFVIKPELCTRRPRSVRDLERPALAAGRRRRRPARELPVHGRRGRKAIRNRSSRRLDHDLRSRERQDRDLHGRHTAAVQQLEFNSDGRLRLERRRRAGDHVGCGERRASADAARTRGSCSGNRIRRRRQPTAHRRASGAAITWDLRGPRTSTPVQHGSGNEPETPDRPRHGSR